ncbi:RelA/SpoT domain-containing protein [Corynebacterium kutscheri]|uniref:RelA/SpoT domain-containing protein n=1 Tax=Corynebacterium kutscheri TaxID=35755 RepID=A0A0F6R0W6_9CORY|nr:GTP pyrophosphokinase [Corynebacterium kutscheri]AKE41530.1 hypothetical protein UL82_06825 [Corynebacterium kutscheri]VEH08808.1 RelA/SpoT domain-containing protein [Corynebacterium kutscheri]VEH09854.1 RelA/SpoT domain-containing protein [Corynebacterium kutscheri]VEH79937.1 RelA/SpoT domain-containing protein [Corynebacterium kutscheri]
MPDKNAIASLHARYTRFLSAHPHCSDDFVDAIEDVLGDAGLTYDRVTARVKEWPSLKIKARKRRPAGELIYPDPWNDIHDIIGVRITTFHSTEIPHIISALTDMFILRRSMDKTAQTQIAGAFGYGSHHLILEISDQLSSLATYQGRIFEVQIRTVLQHAWAEFEHDIRYKRQHDSLDPRVDRAFTLAAGLIELADQQFDTIAAIQNTSLTKDTVDNVHLSAETLPGIIAMITGPSIPQSRTENYRWLEELLLAHKITTVAALRELLDEHDVQACKRALNYQFQPGHIRIIDDLLLRKFGQKHIDLTGATGKYPVQRTPRLQQRLALMKNADILDSA